METPRGRATVGISALLNQDFKRHRFCGPRPLSRGDPPSTGRTETRQGELRAAITRRRCPLRQPRAQRGSAHPRRRAALASSLRWPLRQNLWRSGGRRSVATRPRRPGSATPRLRGERLYDTAFAGIAKIQSRPALPLPDNSPKTLTAYERNLRDPHANCPNPLEGWSMAVHIILFRPVGMANGTG